MRQTPKTKTPTRILVYGTLRVGQHAYDAFDLKTQTKHLGTVRIPGSIYDLGSFPGVKLDGDQEGVVCDVLEVASDASVEHILDRLDRYEGYRADDPNNSLYLRENVEIENFGKCLIYEINRDTSKYTAIKSGDWFNRSA